MRTDELDGIGRKDNGYSSTREINVEIFMLAIKTSNLHCVKFVYFGRVFFVRKRTLLSILC